jgi:hypothetical protein
MSGAVGPTVIIATSFSEGISRLRGMKLLMDTCLTQWHDTVHTLKLEGLVPSYLQYY